MYINQVVRIKWDYYIHVSSTFRVSNGVKKGGVLSPVLFNKYMDELLGRLKRYDLGCYIGHVFARAFGYADDISKAFEYADLQVNA